MNYVTYGGVTVGLLVLAYQLTTWWPGLKALRADPLHNAADLLPFLFAWAYGVLAILSVGGLVGWGARTARWISNWLGDVSLVWGVGGQTGQRAGAVSYLPLTQAGGALVLILTVVMVVLAKKSRYAGDIKRGAWCGICLGTSAGIAGFAAVPLATAANWAGGGIYGAL